MKLKNRGLKIHGSRTATPNSLKIAAARISKQQSEIDSLKAKFIEALGFIFSAHLTSYPRKSV
jgi:hypothetical protein